MPTGAAAALLLRRHLQTLAAITHHPATPEPTLELAAAHPHAQVRVAAVTRTDAAVGVVAAGLADRSPAVRAAAVSVTDDPAAVVAAATDTRQVARQAAANPALPAAAAAELVGAGDLGTLRSLLRNPSVPPDVIAAAVTAAENRAPTRGLAVALFGLETARTRGASVGLSCTAHRQLAGVFARDPNVDARLAAARFVTDPDHAAALRAAGTTGLADLARNPLVDVSALALPPEVQEARAVLLGVIDGIDLTAPHRWSDADQYRAAGAGSGTLDWLLLTCDQTNPAAVVRLLERTGNGTAPAADTVSLLVARFGFPAARLARHTVGSGYANLWSPRVASLVTAAACGKADFELDELAACPTSLSPLHGAEWDTVQSLAGSWTLPADQLVETARTMARRG